MDLASQALSGGSAALLAMLHSCAAGITVVELDARPGAGHALARLPRRPRDGALTP